MPKEIREELGVAPGDLLYWVWDGHSLQVVPDAEPVPFDTEEEATEFATQAVLEMLADAR